MKNLKIHLYKNHEEKPEKIITLPLSALHVADQFLPKSVKSAIAKEGIDLAPCKQLTKEKDLVGTLIEIENPPEKIVISLE